MRWTDTAHSFGEVRTIRKFLIFPKTIGGETRWLERAIITQRYVNNKGLYSVGWGWEDVKWVN